MTSAVKSKKGKTAVFPFQWQQKINITAVQVFVFSFSILFLEATLFSTLLFTHTYLIAMQSIAFALLGIGIGSLVGAWLPDSVISNWAPWAMLANALAIVALFINIISLPETVTYSPLMILPFVFGSAFISHAFSKGNTGTLYFFDLTGAAAGIIFFVILLPLWRAEGNLIFLTLLMVMFAYIQLRHHQRLKWGLLTGQLLLVLLLGINSNTNLLNLSNITRCPSFEPPKKVFCWLEADPDISRLIISKGDLAARIDVLLRYSEKTGKARLWVNYNGMMADGISASKLEPAEGDLRVPHNLTANPDMLIIGTAGNGIIRPARLLAGDQGRLDGLEINSGLADLMTGELKRVSGDVYGYLDRLFVTDARTFLNTHDESYDVITLLNTYTGRLEHSFGAPEYLHTVEAMEGYLAHLNSDGFLIFEIRDTNDLTRAAGLRIVNALTEAYTTYNSGDSDAQDNFYIYEYYPQNQRLVRSNNYTMVLFKNASLTDAEINYLNSWVDDHNELGKQPRVNRLHVPGEASPHDYSRFVTATPEERQQFFTDGSWITTPTTDDRPFLADAKSGFIEVRTHVQQTAIIVLIAILVLLISLWRGKSAQKSTEMIPFWIYFAAIGFGYLLIEISLIQWLQLFTGLPAYTFIFVLGTLLLFSGMGGYISRKWSFRQIIPCFVSLLLLIIAYAIWLQPIMVKLQTAVLLWNSLFVSVLLFPLGFAMGIPLPFGLRLLRQYFSEKEVPLSFGVNSLFATLGSNLAILIALYAGYSIVFKLGALAYLSAFTALVIIMKSHSEFQLNEIVS